MRSSKLPRRSRAYTVDGSTGKNVKSSSSVSDGSEGVEKSNNNLDQEYPADLQPLGFKRYADPDLHKLPHQSPTSLAKIREMLLRGSGPSAATAGATENIVRGVLGSIDRDQFEEYLKNPPYIKLMKRGKNLKQFRRLFLAQELKAYDEGLPPKGQPLDAKSIWVTKFSHDGNHMAVGSKDGSVWIWKVISSPAERWEMDYIGKIHTSLRRNTILAKQNGNLSSNGSNPNVSRRSQKLAEKAEKDTAKLSAINLYAPVFQPHAQKVFREHESDVLDMDWSKNDFLVTASMDKTVSLWHVKRDQSLKTFFHPDFVTCVKFYPLDDRFFLSGCLDHKCRMWSILDEEVIFEFDCQDLVTSMVLSPETGKFTIVGTFNGYIYILETQGFHLVTWFHVTDKDTQKQKAPQAFNSSAKPHHGPRVTCLQCFKAPNDKTLKLMVTSNDSRVRIFDLKTKRCVEVLRGFESGASQHNAQLVVAHNQAVVVSGSNDHWVYGWRLQSSSLLEHGKEANLHQGGVRRSGSLRSLITRSKSKSGPHSSPDSKQEHHHHLHNPLKHLLQHGHGGANEQRIKNNYSISFHAHHSPVTTASIAPPETAKALSLSNDLICELSLLLYKADDQFEMLGSGKHSDKNNNDSDDSDEESFDFASNSMSNGSLLPSPVDAIGTIMITTDSTGLIRVFRADMPAAIRSRVLQGLQPLDLERRDKFGSTDSLISEAGNVPGIVGSPTASGIQLNTTGWPNESNSAAPAPKHCARSNSVFRNALLSRSNSSINSFKRNSLSSSATDADLARSNSFLTPKLRCDVCGGTRFNLMSRGSFSGRENGYYCADCSTLHNNFR